MITKVFVQWSSVNSRKDFRLQRVSNPEMAVHLAVAGDVFHSVLFCAVPFPTTCLGLDLGLN